MTKHFLFKKAYQLWEPFPHIAYLIQTKNFDFWRVTDNQKGDIQIYKYKRNTLDFEYAVWGQNFKNKNEAFQFLRKENK